MGRGFNIERNEKMTTKAPKLNPESLVARIIEELRANPDAQTLLLRALLTNEFLGIPIRLERVEADIAELKADVAVLKADVAVLKVDVAELKVDVAELKVDVAELKTDVGHLKGDVLEMKLHRRIRSLLSQRFNLRRARMMQSPVQDTRSELFEPVEKAFDEGIITDPQETRISETDLILRAQRKDDRAVVWVAVEVSNDIGQRDIDRVRQSADALSVVFQRDAMAVVAGYRIHPRDQARANDAGVHTLLVGENN